jgi:hypothetical protein
MKEELNTDSTLCPYYVSESSQQQNSKRWNCPTFIQGVAGHFNRGDQVQRLRIGSLLSEGNRSPVAMTKPDT